VLRTRDLEPLADLARAAAARAGGGRAALVAISGIDASGKGTLARRLADALGPRAALVGLDPWHAPQTERLDRVDPAATFYRRAFRWDALFADLIDPLVRDRGIDLQARVIETAVDRWVPHHYEWRDIDVVLLEGIFLFRRELAGRYDLRIWVDCPFAAALERALRRNQEGLPVAQITADYQTIYFPAQRLHLELDDPLAAADAIWLNDA
jgi:uridine kinase